MRLAQYLCVTVAILSLFAHPSVKAGGDGGTAYEFDRSVTIDDAVNAIHEILEDEPRWQYVNRLMSFKRFRDFIYVRYDCLVDQSSYLNRVYKNRVFSVAQDIRAALGGSSNYFKIWNNGRFISGSAHQHQNFETKGVFVADLKKKHIAYAILNAAYGETHRFFVFMDPNATEEFERESLRYINTFAGYWENETFRKIHLKDTLVPQEMSQYRFTTKGTVPNGYGHYEKAPDIEVFKVACDLDPDAPQKWQAILASRDN